jgi:hypothetical protein
VTEPRYKADLTAGPLKLPESRIIADLLLIRGRLETMGPDLWKMVRDGNASLDLDDGVKVNYAKFGDLLAESKAITGGKDEE